MSVLVAAALGTRFGPSPRPFRSAQAEESKSWKEPAPRGAQKEAES